MKIIYIFNADSVRSFLTLFEISRSYSLGIARGATETQLIAICSCWTFYSALFEYEYCQRKNSCMFARKEITIYHRSLIPSSIYLFLSPSLSLTFSHCSLNQKVAYWARCATKTQHYLFIHFANILYILCVRVLACILNWFFIVIANKTDATKAEILEPWKRKCHGISIFILQFSYILLRK